MCYYYHHHCYHCHFFSDCDNYHYHHNLGRPPSPPPLPRTAKHFDGPSVLPSVQMRIDPLKSFKNFMHGQADDLPVEAFQRCELGLNEMQWSKMN